MEINFLFYIFHFSFIHYEILELAGNPGSDWNPGGYIVGHYRDFIWIALYWPYRIGQTDGLLHEDRVAVVFSLACLAGPCRFSPVGVSCKYSNGDPRCDLSQAALFHYTGCYADDVSPTKGNEKEKEIARSTG